MTTFGRLLVGATLITLGAVALSSCSSDGNLGSDNQTVVDGSMGAGGAGAVDSGTHACVPAACQNHVYACGDCVDNDADGRIDMDDPDCLGPCHNAEDTFFGSIPGQNHAPCTQDCYFDQDSGSGNDGCLWTVECDPLEVAPDFPPSGGSCAYDPKAKLPRGDSCAEAMAQQPPECETVCGPLTPNGCDCFGCCAIPGAPTTVWLGSVDELGNPSCDLEHVADPKRCKPCTQVPACLNVCEECELCLGKRALPAECNHGDNDCPAPRCERGAPCGLPCLDPCADGETCITGCCRPILR